MNSDLCAEYLIQSQNLLDQSKLKLEHCLGQLTELQICRRPQPGMNSIANLILHMTGNLRQWAVVPNTTGAVDARDRDHEFADCTIAKSELQELLKASVTEASAVFNSLRKSDPTNQSLLDSQTIQGFDVSRLGAITHTTAHFVGHTHQVIMMTRLMLGTDYVFHWGTDGGDRRAVPI